MHLTVLGILILGMVSSIRFNIGYQGIYVDLSLVILIISNFALLVHLMLRSKTNPIQPIRQERNKLNLLTFLLIAILLILCLQGYILNIYDTSLFTYHLNVFFNMMLFACLLYCLSLAGLDRMTFMLAIATYSLANSLLGVLQYVFNKSFLPFTTNDTVNYYEGAVVTKRVFGFVGASNGAGNLGAILFSVLLYYYLKKRSMFGFVALSLNLLFVVLTFTRIGYLSIGVQCIIFLLFSKVKNHHQWIKRSLLGILSLFVGVVAYQMFYDDVYRILFLDRGDTESQRFTQFYDAFQLFKDHIWFGVGAGQYVPFRIASSGVEDIALHSQFMNILVEQGLISFGLFALFYILLWVWSVRKFKGEVWLPLSLMIGNLIVTNFNPNQYYSICIYTFTILAFGLVFLKEPKDAVYQNERGKEALKHYENITCIPRPAALSFRRTNEILSGSHTNTERTIS